MRLARLRRQILRTLCAVAALTGPAAQAATPPSANPLQLAIASPSRSAAFAARDAARHPASVLAFFGLRANATVVEIWPGGGYWTEILAPALNGRGMLYEALPTGSAEDAADAASLRSKLAARAAEFGQVRFTALGPASQAVAPPGSADFVLTFRNVHNWMDGGYADAAFAAFYRALKPGGILGVEEHRGDPAEPQDPKAASGYVRQDYTIALAEKAGFHLLGSSEVNANPRDTRHWPQGVWTLPPSFALGAKDHTHYAAIGEADNFVVKFQK